MIFWWKIARAVGKGPALRDTHKKAEPVTPAPLLIQFRLGPLCSATPFVVSPFKILYDRRQNRLRVAGTLLGDK